MNVKEVFCEECFKWRKQEELVEARKGEFYCDDCGSVLARTDEYNPNKERKYTIRVKGIDSRFNWLMRDCQLGIYVFGGPTNPGRQTVFTEKELARDNLAYMLYNDAFKIDEVDE